MKLQPAYLTGTQITDMAEAALTSYDWTASWREAGRAAREHAADEWGIRATDAQVATAVRIAQTKWQAIAMSVRSAQS